MEKNIILSILMISGIFYLESCKFDTQDENIGINFSIDMNKVRQLAGSSSGISSASSAVSSQTSSATFVDTNDELMFFGVVLRQVDGAVKDSQGKPLGTIIPGANKIFNVWQNPEEFTVLNSTGKLTIQTEVPSPSTLSVTFYAVFIGENHYSNGPEAWTSVFYVGGPYNVEGANAQIVVRVEGEMVEDDHRTFMNWAGIFANSSGAPLAYTNIDLKHCKLGFEFKQDMFEKSLEDRHLFRTDAKGMIDSVMPSGVNWEVRAGGKLIKPCGTTFDVPTYGGANGIFFGAFIDTELFTDPASFVADSRITGGAYFTETNFSDTSLDHDGDGMPTADEITARSNPFMHNEIFNSRFDGDLVHVSKITAVGSDMELQYNVNTNNVSSGSCSSGTIYFYDGSTWVSGNETPYLDGGGGTDYENCKVTLYGSEFSGLLAADSTAKIMVKLDTGYEFDLDGNATPDPLYLYFPFRWCQGTGCDETVTFSSSAVYRRTRGNGASDEITLVTDYSALYPSGCGETGFEYLLQITGDTTASGGDAFFSDSIVCSTPYSDASARLNSLENDFYEFNFWHGVNVATPDLYFCYKKALNSNVTSSLGTHTFAFIVDPDYSCSYPQSINYFYISDDFDINLNNAPYFEVEFSNEVSAFESYRLNFDGDIYSLCITESSQATSYFYSTSGTYVSDSIPGTGSYYLSSIEFFTAAGCSGGAFQYISAPPSTYSMNVVDTGGYKIFVTSGPGYDGNLGGLSGADSICQTHATNASLASPSSYRAILSDETTSASSRFNYTAGPVKNTNNETVMSTMSEFFAGGTLAYPVRYDEYGVDLGVTGENVWTGSDKDGLAVSGQNCSSWTSNASIWGYFSISHVSTTVTTTNWLYNNQNYCSNTYRLYCTNVEP